MAYLKIAAGARRPLSADDSLTNRGPSFALGGLSFLPDGHIEDEDGININGAEVHLGTMLGDAVISHPTPGAEIIIQFEHLGVAAVFKDGAWWTHTAKSELSDLAPAIEQQRAA